MCVKEVTHAEKRYVHFLKLLEDCRFVPENPFEKFAIKRIVNNGSIVRLLPKKISSATEFLLKRRKRRGTSSASFNVA